MLKVTVSGSFHRHMPAVYGAVGDLRALGVDVLSPSDPRVVDHLGDFLFVASDKLRSVKLVQDRHLQAIKASHFLWVVCPDGYIGLSTSAEIMWAHGAGTAVFSDFLPLDVTLSHYVQKVPSLKWVVQSLTAKDDTAACASENLLLYPDLSIEASIRNLESLKPILTGKLIARDDEIQQRIDTVRRLVTHSIEF